MYLVEVEGGALFQDPRFIAILVGILIEIGSAIPMCLELPNICLLLCWERLTHLLTSGSGYSYPCCPCVLSCPAG